jgi:hypothetical protein
MPPEAKSLPDQRKRAQIDALARDIAERRAGMPAYLVDDEQWASALAEAEATYEPPKPLSPLQEAVRKARGHYTGEEVERMILATHPPGCPCKHHSGQAASDESELGSTGRDPSFQPETWEDTDG